MLEPSGSGRKAPPVREKCRPAAAHVSQPALVKAVGQQLPQAEEQRIETQLRELHRTGRRTAVVEVQLRRDEETFRVRVLCVRA